MPGSEQVCAHGIDRCAASPAYFNALWCNVSCFRPADLKEVVLLYIGARNQEVTAKTVATFEGVTMKWCSLICPYKDNRSIYPLKNVIFLAFCTFVLKVGKNIMQVL